jgi:hypothetical protein
VDAGPVHARLRTDKAFVIPSSAGLSSGEAADVKARATDAARGSFRDGMLLAAALVAVGGIVSAVGIRGKGRTVDG